MSYIDKTNLGVMVSRSLWTEFRKRAIDEGCRTGELLERTLTDYLGKAKQTDRPIKEAISKQEVKVEPVVKRAARFRGQ